MIQRISISIPDELAADLALHGAGINTSLEARVGIESAIARVKARKALTTDERLAAAVKRIDADDKVDEREDAADGAKAGADWVLNHARHRELRRFDKINIGFFGARFDDDQLAFTIAAGIRGSAASTTDDDVQAIFLRDWPDLTSAYCRGWIEGAQEAIAAIEAKRAQIPEV